MIAIIGDMHFGARNSSPIFHKYFEDVINDIFQEIKNRKVSAVIQLGDLFDNRTELSLYAWDSFNRSVIKNIRKLKKDFRWYQLVGNHDSRYRETLSLNTPRLRLSDEPGFVIIDEPKEAIIDGKEFLLVPWINKENKQSVFDFVNSTQAKYCCGHFEFDGFDFAKGIPGKATLNHKEFSKFETVFSGHYHTFSIKDNVCYTGTPYELTWIDCDDPKGYILLGETAELIPTEKTIHSKILYKEGERVSEDSVRGKFVRVIVNGRPDKADYYRFLGEVESFGPLDVSIQENFQDELTQEKTSVKLKETREVIVEFLEKSNVDLDKGKLMEIFDQLHNEALNEM